MELVRLGEPGREQPAVRHDGTVHDLAPLASVVDGAFLAADGIARTREALAAGSLPELVGAETLRGPARRPALGGALHRAELRRARRRVRCGGAGDARAVLKHPNTVVGPYDDVVVPPGADQVDWEVELAVVVGRRAHLLGSVEEAAAHVAGYTVSNDVSERRYQLQESGGSGPRARAARPATPWAPRWCRLDEVPDVQGLRLWSTVGGEPRQDSTTADMLFDVATIGLHVSQHLALDPGDVIDTGTPQGVALSGRFPYLRAGDTMSVGIDGLGEQTQRLVAQGA